MPNAQTCACRYDLVPSSYAKWLLFVSVSRTDLSAREHGVDLLGGEKVFQDCGEAKFLNPCMKGILACPNIVTLHALHVYYSQ